VHSARIDVGLKKQIAPDLPQAREITVAGAHRAYRSYLAVMGVEPRLVDIAARVDSRRIYILSGDEIARLGIETRGRYETVWLADKDSSGRPLVMKSITEPMATDGSDYQTSTIRAWCRYKGWILFSYQRRVRPNEDGVLFVVSVTVGSSSNLLQESIAVKVIHASRVFTNLDFFHKAIAAGDFTFVEAFSPRKGPGWSRVVKLSIVGLADALTGWQKSCMKS